MSGLYLITFLCQNVKLLVLDNCSLTSIPNVLSALTEKMPNISTLWLKRSTSRTQNSSESFTNQSTCIFNMPHGKLLKVSQIEEEIDESILSSLLSYMTRCTAIEEIEISAGLVNVPSFNSQKAVSLSLRNNNIKELDSGSFSELSNLRHLDLSDNKIVRIPGGVFQGNKHLRTLQMDSNNITSVTKQSFLGTY